MSHDLHFFEENAVAQKTEPHEELRNQAASKHTKELYKDNQNLPNSRPIRGIDYVVDEMPESQHKSQKEAAIAQKSPLVDGEHIQTHISKQTVEVVGEKPECQDVCVGEHITQDQRNEAYGGHDEPKPKTGPNQELHTQQSNVQEEGREGQHEPTFPRPQYSDMAVAGPKTEFHGLQHTEPNDESAAEARESQHSELPHASQYIAISIDDLTNGTTSADDSVFNQDMNTFSDYESTDSASFYSSFLSYATDYYWENGRRYHAHQDGRYPLPNDETELDREDMKHHEWMLITGFRHHLSPIGPNPQMILDIGTGTGIWAMQVAELYPSADVIGTDISPVQPKWVPPNLTFEVDDLEAEWLYKHDSIDLINVRFMFLAIKDWPAILAQAYRKLKPGGYIELSELGIRPKATNLDSPQPVVIFQWLELLAEAMGKMGLNMRIAHDFEDLLTQAGFVDVVKTRFEIPWGTWPKNRREKVIGFWHIEQLKQGLQGIIIKLFAKVYGWMPEQTELFLVTLRKELDNKNYHILDHG